MPVEGVTGDVATGRSLTAKLSGLRLDVGQGARFSTAPGGTMRLCLRAGAGGLQRRGWVPRTQGTQDILQLCPRLCPCLASRACLLHLPFPWWVTFFTRQDSLESYFSQP